MDTIAQKMKETTKEHELHDGVCSTGRYMAVGWHYLLRALQISDPNTRDWSLPHGCLAQEGRMNVTVNCLYGGNICISPQNVGSTATADVSFNLPLRQPVTLSPPTPLPPSTYPLPTFFVSAKVDKKQASEEERPNAQRHFPLANKCDCDTSPFRRQF